MAKKDKNLTITGRIIDRATRNPVAGLRVEAWDKDLVHKDQVGTSETDANGAFTISFKEKQLKELFVDREPGFFFRVVKDGDVVRSTEDSVLWNVTDQKELTIEVGGADEGEVFVVQGTVKLADGSPAADFLVTAFDRDLRSEVKLGDTRSGRDGSYLIDYSSSQFAGAELQTADLVVKVFGINEQVLVASPVMFNAPPSAQIDVTIPRALVEPPSLFERIARSLRPLLGEVRIDELEENADHQDLSFIAGETRFDINAVARWVLAHRFEAEKLEPEFWFALLGGSFFRFQTDKSVAEQFQKLLNSLASIDDTTVRKSLVGALNENDIASRFRERIEEWIKLFREFVARRAVSDEAEPSLLKGALEDAGIKTPEKQAFVSQLVFEHGGLTPEVVATLQRDQSFAPREIADLQTSFELADLTQADHSVVRVIKREFDVREPEQIRTLARKSEDEWIELVQKQHGAGALTLPFKLEGPGTQKPPAAEAFGKELERKFREAFPTTAFAGGLSRALNNGGSRGMGQAEKMGKFLDDHEDFEFLKTRVDDYLKKNLRRGAAPLAEDQSFVTELKAVQRVFKLAPNFSATDTLLADGVHSAQQAYRLGKSEFVRRYEKAPGFTKETAKKAWNSAADTHAAALTIVGDLKALEGNSLPQVLQNNNAALEQFPNWNNLFQTGDICECEHCRSVLGPAAYFADLLVFLRDRKAKNPAETVKDILFQRRPDLGYIELNCENALTPLPYVDVVCEVLESVIAGGENDVELVGLTAIPDDSAATKAAVATAFENQNLVVAEGFSLSQVDPLDFDLWVVHADNITYLLKKKATPNFFAEILRNTKTSADELRAYPQYVNPKAYVKLRQARFPFGLPFDLFAEEVRQAMQKSNLQRWDLMRTFRGPAAPNNATEGDVAAEYFKISIDPTATIDEKTLILVAETTDAGQQVIWGEPSNPAWLTEVSNVKEFLNKTNLEYKQLLALLDLEFLNPTGDIVINHQDSSCDTAKKDLQNLDAPKLDRFHRFLRLWRKLPEWKFWELDLVIRHPAIGGGSLDEMFLINLRHFVELRKRLGARATVEQVLSLFGNLNTKTRFTELHKPRANAIYQNLFLNRRLINPVDPAFEIDPVTDDLAAGQLISGHLAVVLSALGIREADLSVFQGLTRVSDGTPYINDDLTLANLSYLSRHAWLSKTLKYKSDDWRTLLKLVAQKVPTFANLAAQQTFLEQEFNIKASALTQAQVDQLLLEVFHQDVLDFASPKAARDFIEKIDRLKETRYKPDELSWLLTADRSAKAAMKESDAARFLSGLRKALQQIQAANDPAQFDFLNVAVPTDTAQLSALLTTLLQQLNRTEAEVKFFQQTLIGAVELKAAVQGLPAGFTFPAAITGAANNIPITYDEPNTTLVFKGMMTDAQRTTLLDDPSLAAVNEEPAYRNAIEELFQLSQAAPTNFASQEIDIALPGITLPPNMPSLPIRYNVATQKLSFTGVMTNAERLALVAILTNPAAAIEELFQTPRMAVKFFEPVFTTPLANLPAAIDFKAQLAPELAAKISYDDEERLLVFNGIMKQSEQTALNALVPNVLPEEIAYHNAVNDLVLQPQNILPPDERIWLTDADLDSTIPANDTLAKRLANAALKALAYLSRTLVNNEVVEQASAQLGLTEALTRRLLTHYDVLPIPPAPPNTSLLTYLTGDFATTIGAIDYATLKEAFDGWFWASRVATIWKKWKLTLEEWEHLVAFTASAEILDFLDLPLDSAAPAAPIERFLRSLRLIRLRDTLPETGITFFEVLEKLNLGSYATAADFGADVELVNEEWLAGDVADLVATLDLTFPNDYLLAENWDRIRRAFYFMGNLGAGPAIVKTFAAATMSDLEAKRLKELLRAQFGTETWLTLSAEIQDQLREQKRDALSAYLLTQPQPADAPTGKWENTNDLYAYYLLDVEMCSCMLTSRLVQASGSVQLFVQRCFMGLEPDVEVNDEGDGSAWRWWKWMKKYRVWEANRKVFLWPENWIEPELRKDKSQFFRELEEELLQDEITQYTSETALQNYLQKLDGVAQLEPAGFYHEDDGELTIVHVFGRTKGAEPHQYYYRRFDYRQWTPWEKIELDIEGDYLIPAVVNKRLFLFWPIFKEVPHEDDGTVRVPRANTGSEATFKVDKTWKKLRLQMAVSDYRQGKWSPKKVSKSFDESGAYRVEIVRKHYAFFPLDRSELDGRFGICYDGASLGSDGFTTAGLSGTFEIAGCTGAPELVTDLNGNFVPLVRAEEKATGPFTSFLKWAELLPLERGDKPENDFALQIKGLANEQTTQLLIQTPGLFKMTPPWHLSYFDKLIVNGLSLLQTVLRDRLPVPYGSWMPYFFNDKKRTFFVLPSLQFRRGREGKAIGSRLYYPDIKKVIRQLEDFFEGQIRTWAEAVVPTLTAAEKQIWGEFFRQQLPLDTFPPYSDEQLEDYTVKYFMRFFQGYLGGLALLALQLGQYHFKNFYHPFVCHFIKQVYNPLQGIPAMMSRPTQLLDSGFSFKQTYQPTFWVVQQGTEEFYPRENVDFSPDGAYSPYNWELFFHVPLLVANSLSQNQHFEEARDWYHFIFNPLGLEGPVPGGSAMSKYWITKPFFETTDPQYVQQRIENIMLMLAGDTSVPGFSADLKKALEDQVFDWRTNPFEPHRIANYRTVAYQKTTVMKYIDNLIAWGDYLFRQDSMESINEATQLYVLADEILGPRPKKVPPQAKPPLETFNELEKEFDKFSNALVEVENVVPPQPGDDPGPDPAPLPMLYFCIPHNEKLVGYWDTVADRLYKIRHCMNIEGVVRQLSLFEPPIDPGALVKAVAGGMDISSALADLNAPLPLYRFNVVLQRAKEVCNDVRSLGSALLSALEKKDSEALAQLRQTHEIEMLNAVKAVREIQIKEAKENVEALKRAKVTTETRRDYYRDIEKIIAPEQLSLDKLAEAQQHSSTAQSINIGASVLGYIPNVTIGGSGFGGSPHVNAQWGTGNIISALQAASGGEQQLASFASYEANKAATNASHDRRFSDWKLQESLAEREIAHLEKQIDAAEVRIAIAEQELENQKLQIENAKSVDEFMRTKYTNKDLYQWQIAQISSVYFRSYRLAYDLAKRAERCFRFELGLQDSSYINFGYWDSLKKGLLSGEKLALDLHRLENAMLEQNKREFELSKHVSLVGIDPLALVKLRETGRCFFRLPEEVFDLDFPGHYFRRIKSVSLTLPCVVGPYTTISCTLRLLKNSIRINTTNGDSGYPHNIDDQGLPADDTRFVENNIPVKAVAVSSAQNDSGVFELSFRDDRYLPFEGAGAVSEWSLELFNDLPANNPDFGKALRQFDYNTISDAVLHIKYTAREDAGPFKNGAIQNLRDYFSGVAGAPSVRLFNLRQEFPAQWDRFLHPTNPANGNVFTFEMSPELFSFKDLDKTLELTTIWLLARCTDDGAYRMVVNPPLPPPPPPGSDVMKLAKVNQYGGLHFGQRDISALGLTVAATDPPLAWSLKMTRPGGGNLDVDVDTNEMEVSDVILAVGYQWQP